MPAARLSRSFVRRVVGALAVLALLAAAIGVHRIVSTLFTASDASTPLRADESATSTNAVDTSTADTDALGDGDPGAPLHPGTGVPLVGPGVTEPGLLLVATVDDKGGFSVIESVVVADARDTLSLRVPDLSDAGAPFDKASLEIANVRATASGQALEIPNNRMTTTRNLTFSDSTTIEIRYHLGGNTDRVGPEPGTAVAALAPITAGLDPDLPVAVVVRGWYVRGVTCPTLKPSLQACGVGNPPAWQVAEDLSRSSALVTTQYDVLQGEP